MTVERGHRGVSLRPISLPGRDASRGRVNLRRRGCAAPPSPCCRARGRPRGIGRAADPDVVETWKWKGTPVWEHDGIICTGESYKAVVKLTFAKGASLSDPTGLFNSSLDGNVRRAIDIAEGEEVDAAAFKALVREAIELNSARPPKASKRP